MSLINLMFIGVHKMQMLLLIDNVDALYQKDTPVHRDILMSLDELVHTSNGTIETYVGGS